MGTMARRVGILALGLAGCAAPVLAGEGWYVGAGVAGADVGLDESRLGWTVEVGRTLPLPGTDLDFSFRGEYVQKAGNQPRLFVPEDEVGAIGDEELVLHYLQPSVSLGRTWPLLPVAPRLYLGAAMGLKLSESWTRPVEDGLDIIGYEETDFLLHAGASLAWRRWLLDLRWEQGLVSQLLIDEGVDPLEKAEDPLADVDDPEEGKKITCWRVGLGWSF